MSVFILTPLSINSQPSPPPLGNPDDRKPDGTRSPSCTENSDLTNVIPLTPLLPLTNNNSNYIFAEQTTLEYPTFWFYIPYQISEVTSADFYISDLNNDEQKTVYRTSLQLPQIPGFFSINILENNQPLEINSTGYRWTLIISCSNDNFVYHEGLIKRVALNNELNNQLQGATLEEKINLYLEHNLWYDLGNYLPEIQQNSQLWQNILEKLGLLSLEKEPISETVIIP